jgi:hypothetical protein
MNGSKKDSWQIIINGWLLLALVLGAMGAATPAESASPIDANTAGSASPVVLLEPEALNRRRERSVNGWNYGNDPLNNDGFSGDPLSDEGNYFPDFPAATPEPGFVEVPLTRTVSVTIEVSVPDFTPGAVYIFGNQPELGDWDPGVVPMISGEAGTWTITLEFLEDTLLAFNFGRGSTETEETKADGNTAVSARVVTVTYGTGGGQSESYSVANWRDPIVVDHFPIDGTSTVPIDTHISVSWSQAMSVGTEFNVEGPEGPISGTFTYLFNTFTYVFTPAQMLDIGETYTVTAAGQTDAGGDVQQVPVQFSFDTMVPTSVELVAIGEKPGVTDSWWWVSWPWLMVVLMALSLVGLLWINRRQRRLADR